MAGNKMTIVQVDVETQLLIKKAAVLRNTSTAKYLATLIKEFGGEEDADKIVLTVPSLLTKDNEDSLRQWLRARMEVIFNSYYPKHE